MTELTIERTFAADVETVFRFVTDTDHLMKWWGPEGTQVSDHELDLSRKGAWWSRIVNAEGGTYKMGGEVTKIDPPHAVEFTWGWFDENDIRGHESRVRFEVSANTGGGSRFVLIHTGLPDEESMNNHNMGWTSSLRKLEKLVQ